MFLELLYSLDWTQIVLGLLIAGFSAFALWYRKRFPVWLKFWKSVLEGLSGIPELQQDVKGIRYYVAPNGGGSMVDSIKRTESAVGTLGEQVDLLTQTIWAENDSEDDVGRFHSNAAGEIIYVNQPFARMLGVGKTELLGWKFLNFVHSNDVDRVRRHWELCRAEHRQCRANCHMVTVDNEIIEVEVVATPVPELPPSKRWVGVIRKAH